MEVHRTRAQSVDARDPGYRWIVYGYIVERNAQTMSGVEAVQRDNVLHQAAAAGIGLNADAIVRAVDGKVGYANGAAAVRLTADRHAAAGIEMVM